MEYFFKLAFKGDRTYLQGADIAQTLIEFTGPANNLTIQLHRITSHPLIARYVDNIEISELRISKKLFALMVFTDEMDDKKFLSVTEDDRNEITERKEYDESLVTEDANISGKRIEQAKPGAGNFFERVVALNKKLMNTIVELHPWVFSRIDLKYAPIVSEKLSITLKHDIGGHTFKSIIRGDGVDLGSIYFTRRS